MITIGSGEGVHPPADDRLDRDTRYRIAELARDTLEVAQFLEWAIGEFRTLDQAVSDAYHDDADGYDEAASRSGLCDAFETLHAIERWLGELTASGTETAAANLDDLKAMIEARGAS